MATVKRIERIKGNFVKKIKAEINQLAEIHGINEIRFIDAEDLEPREVFHKRQPKVLMPDAKSLIVSSIYIAGFFLPGEDPTLHARTSRLTLSGFYFNIVKPLLPIRDYLISKGYQAIIYDGLLEDDCIPLKAAALKAGLGWIGKNTLLVNQKYGTWQALGGIITDADLSEIYPAHANLCGTCTECIDKCPTNALTTRVLNRAKCLSNLLEEGDMPEEITAIPESYFFECDICQEACPWNKEHFRNPLPIGAHLTLAQQKDLLELFRFDVLMEMDEETYQKKILPLLTGVDLPYELFKRNVQLARPNHHTNKEKAR